ncbi:unnamed protein product [Protopolystoma xenopodis]|uniref:Uncharacterized protein n=1 Tax=Protopolystoma xenopodis TaxID=117903 RepID=A0A3S5BYB2_9PLAT|nr:unnamed protein product [Protopolystoma xenopodis]
MGVPSLRCQVAIWTQPFCICAFFASFLACSSSRLPAKLYSSPSPSPPCSDVREVGTILTIWYRNIVIPLLRVADRCNFCSLSDILAIMCPLRRL